MGGRGGHEGRTGGERQEGGREGEQPAVAASDNGELRGGRDAPRHQILVPQYPRLVLPAQILAAQYSVLELQIQILVPPDSKVVRVGGYLA
eukprot:3464907-Rhodomonas_salina.1